MTIQGDVEKILNTHLGSREREIIKMHFGVDTPDGYPMSLENISHRSVRLSICCDVKSTWCSSSRKSFNIILLSRPRTVELSACNLGMNCFFHSVPVAVVSFLTVW